MLVLALAACVGLPTTGPVTSQEIASHPRSGQPAGPARIAAGRGASPDQIIQGFIRAGRGPQDGYRVAREFLTEEFRAEWKPNAGVAISDSPIVPEQTGPDQYQVEVSVLARVNETGNYSDLEAPEQVALDYQLRSERRGRVAHLERTGRHGPHADPIHQHLQAVRAVLLRRVG